MILRLRRKGKLLRLIMHVKVAKMKFLQTKWFNFLFNDLDVPVLRYSLFYISIYFKIISCRPKITTPLTPIKWNNPTIIPVIKYLLEHLERRLGKSMTGYKSKLPHSPSM